MNTRKNGEDEANEKVTNSGIFVKKQKKLMKIVKFQQITKFVIRNIFLDNIDTCFFSSGSDIDKLSKFNTGLSCKAKRVF